MQVVPLATGAYVQAPAVHVPTSHGFPLLHLYRPALRTAVRPAVVA